MTEENPTINLTTPEIPLEVVNLLTGRGFITGKSGSGKSNTAGLLAEKLLEQGYPLLIVDTEGEYYGLKEQYEVLHVGADDECDLQVSTEHAEKIAEITLEQNIPIILDVSGYIEEDKAENIIQETVQSLFNKEKKAKKPYLVIAEEIHEYVPEKHGLSECGKTLIRVAKRGRKRGLGIVGVSQRPADVKKDFITQCNWRAWHLLNWDNDTDVVRRVLDKNYATRIKELDIGEAFLEAEFAFDDERARQVRFERKQTFDAGATPDLGDFERPELKSVSGSLVEELEEISEEKRRRETRVEQLENQVEDKNERIDELESQLDDAQDMRDMAEQFTQALTQQGNGDVDETLDEIREEKNKEIRRLKKENKNLKDELSELEGVKERLKEYEDIEDKAKSWEENQEVAREALQRLAEVFDLDLGDDERLRRRAKKLEERVEELKAQSDMNREVLEQDIRVEDAAEFLEDNTVKEFMKKAISNTDGAEEHFWNALTVIAQNDGAKTEDLVPLLDVGKSSINNILRGMEDHKILVSEGKPKTYELNYDGVSDIKEMKAKRRRIREQSKKLKDDGGEGSQ